MDAWDAPVTVDRLEAFVEPDLCLAHLTPTRERRAGERRRRDFVWLGMVLAISFRDWPAARTRSSPASRHQVRTPTTPT
jgi:hypothetical protein